jgi:hypothetical protein
MMKRLGILCSFLILAILITGCVTVLSADCTVELKANENWEVRETLLMEGTSFAEYGEMVTEALNQMVNTTEEGAPEVEFTQGNADKDGNIPLIITMKGSTWVALNEMLGTPDAVKVVTEDKKEYILFSLPSTGLDSQGLSVSTAPDVTFRLAGFPVVETNGNKQGNQVVWTNPTETMTAKLSLSGGGLPWWVFLIIGIVVVIIVVVILLATGVFKSSKTPKAQQTNASYAYPPQGTYQMPPMPQQPYPPQPPAQTPAPPAATGVQFCPKCGNKLAAEAMFCPRCGNRVKS